MSAEIVNAILWTFVGVEILILLAILYCASVSIRDWWRK
jgi:hypothetical protein